MGKMIFSAVVFDMDGTLFDTERACRQVWQDVGQELSCPQPARDYARFVGLSQEADRQQMLRLYGPDFPADAFLDAVLAEEKRRFARLAIPLKPGAREVLALLHDRRIPLALATSTFRDHARQRMERAGLADYFQVMITGDQVSRGKPDPEIYLAACRALGMPPEQCLAVEDSPNGFRSAHSAGLHTVLIPDLAAPDPELEALAYRRFDSLTGLARALEDILPPPVSGSLPRRRPE